MSPFDPTYVAGPKGPSAKRAVAQAVESPRERMQRWRRRVGTAGAAVLTVVMGYSVLYGHNGFFAYRHKVVESRELAAQVQRLQQENQRLEVHVDRMQNDPDAIERQAREELHYARSGEVIYTLPSQHGGAAQPASSTK